MEKKLPYTTQKSLRSHELVLWAILKKLQWKHFTVQMTYNKESPDMGQRVWVEEETDIFRYYRDFKKINKRL